MMHGNTGTLNGQGSHHGPMPVHHPQWQPGRGTEGNKDRANDRAGPGRGRSMTVGARQGRAGCHSSRVAPLSQQSRPKMVECLKIRDGLNSQPLRLVEPSEVETCLYPYTDI
jgi:hypothetical protein